MIDVKRLKGIIAENDKSKTQVAKEIGMSRTTFERKMDKGVFGSDEIEKIIEVLNIDDPMPIFFAKK